MWKNLERVMKHLAQTLRYVDKSATQDARGKLRDGQEKRSEH